MEELKMNQWLPLKFLGKSLKLALRKCSNITNVQKEVKFKIDITSIQVCYSSFKNQKNVFPKAIIDKLGAAAIYAGIQLAFTVPPATDFC